MIGRCGPGSDDEDAGGLDLDDPPAYATGLLQAFALAALRWGRLEAEVDHLLMLTFTDAEQAGLKPKMTLPWDRKCDAIRDRFTGVASLAALTVEGQDIAEKLREAADSRHALVHGAFCGFLPGSPPRLHLLRYAMPRGSDRRFVQKSYALSEADLRRFQVGIMERTVLVLDLMMKVSRVSPTEPLAG